MTALSNLKAGDKLPALTAGPIRPLDLALFAGGSGDHNPIHVDKSFAESAGFPDVFAHGMLSMAYLAQVLTKSFAQNAIRSYGVRFASITPVKATVTCNGEVTEIFEEAGETRARLALTATIDGGVVTLQGDAVVALS